MNRVALGLLVLALLGAVLTIAYRAGLNRGTMVGACAVVVTIRPDIDWSKECGTRHGR